jgi:hypothetical protein
LRLHAEHEASNDQALTSRVEGAIGFARLLAQSGANYFRYNPTAAMQLSALTQQDSTYISHELFGENWRLTSFGEIAAQLSNADLTFGASAVLIGHIDRYSLPPAGHEILKLVTSPIVKEAVKDSFGSPQFRQDIFVRGPVREFSPQERLERLRQMRFVLAIARADVSLNISGPLGDLRLPPESYGPLLDFLATQNYAPKSFAAFEQILPGRSPEQIIEELLVLIGASYVWPVQDDASTAAAQERCNALNAFICKRARSSSAIGFLASPVVGGGIAAHRVWQLFLLAIAEGATSAEEWADFAKLHLESTGEQMFNQGKPIEGAVERAAFLVAVARAFEVRHLPVLRAIGVSAG